MAPPLDTDARLRSLEAGLAELQQRQHHGRHVGNRVQQRRAQEHAEVDDAEHRHHASVEGARHQRR